MRGNKRAKGHGGKPYPGGHTDPTRTAAYGQLNSAMIRTTGVAYWGELAEFAYWSYDLLNPLCFGGRIAHPLFQFCRVMPYGHCLGQSYTVDLDRPVIDVFLSLWERRPAPYLAVFDTITHEMMHFAATMAWRGAGRGRYRTSHNNEFWLAGVVRASPPLGVDLGRLEKPFEFWPYGGRGVAECRRIEAALRERRHPWQPGGKAE
jgi:hypothetical protein